MFVLFMIYVCLQGCKNSKNSGSIKTGFVCPSSIKVHVNNLKVNVQYCSTHIWHDMEIGKQRLFTEDRSMIAGTFISFFLFFIIYTYIHYN